MSELLSVALHWYINTLLVIRLLKANCLYCHLLEFDGVVLLDNTKGWAVGSPQEEKILMAEDLKEKLERLKEHLKETVSPSSRER